MCTSIYAYSHLSVFNKDHQKHQTQGTTVKFGTIHKSMWWKKNTLLNRQFCGTQTKPAGNHSQKTYIR